MDIERGYTKTGLPAYVIVVKNAREGADSARSLVYPRAHSFDKLWAQGREPAEAIVAEARETR